ncbi:MAG: Fe-S cluster assembly protein SufD [Alphaproteobacteria bacterium]|nr:Fe-S cluster assembly protein SufD [Alphaproteobacteria bacterium]
MTAVDYQQLFAQSAPELPGAELDWLAAMRDGAIRQFVRDGFPSPRVEEWKYAALGPLAKTRFELAGTTAADLRRTLDRAAMPAESYRVVFVNGRLREDLSELAALPPGVTVKSLAATIAENPERLQPWLTKTADLTEDRLSGVRDERPFAMVAMNTAFATDGIVIHLARESAAELPIHIINLTATDSNDRMTQPRNIIIAEEEASALIVETYAAVGETSYLTNAVTQVFAAKDAHIRHYRLQAEAATAFHIATTLAHLDTAAAYDSFVLSIGSAFSRNEVRVALDGEHVHCRLNGAYLGRGRQHHDNWTRVDHLKSNGTVSETYKSVLDDKSRGAFQGKIRVWPDAQKTDAHQLNNNLLLSADAQADSKPELEILADDVRCSHGSTVGDIDESALFYLCARGIDEGRARDLLVEAFIGDLIDHIGFGTAHDYFRDAFEDWLAAVRREHQP